MSSAVTTLYDRKPAAETYPLNLQYFEMTAKSGHFFFRFTGNQENYFDITRFNSGIAMNEDLIFLIIIL